MQQKCNRRLKSLALILINSFEGDSLKFRPPMSMALAIVDHSQAQHMVLFTYLFNT